MIIVKLNKNSNGSHDDSIKEHFDFIPEGWLDIPENIKIPHTYPFMEVIVTDGAITELIPDEESYNMAHSEGAERIPDNNSNTELLEVLDILLS